jgi:maltose alpha-D-glucosyltransferase / alpha-amylase
MPTRPQSARLRQEPETGSSVEAPWYQDAVIYQLHVRSFYDSDNDGIGDFEGLRQKLDYLQDLGVAAVWLLPFYPSPLRDDGYDIANYTDVNPSYGDLRAFKGFVREAHARGLRVITELVLNHTSDQHPWFQRARRAKQGNPARDFYVWSDTPEKYQDARIVFKDFEVSNWAWDPVAKAYYWHRFYSHQPDLNFDNPRVQQAMFDALDYWLRLGVDGVRLDAVPYLYEREGTNCENLPETHAFLKRLRQHVDQRFPGRMLLAEANQWPEDVIAYFGNGDECHAAFHFPVMPRLFMAIHLEDRFPIADILRQTPAIPDTCQWFIFLRNHDELTLEMVTDEERDYMYRVYARDHQARINLGIRRRLAPLLGNNRRRIELMNGLLCSLPGTPVIYYGDEIGMGDNIYLGDRNGVRTPMQWSPDRNAGFSGANPQRLYSPVIIDSEYLFEAVNVETQQKNPNSLLWWMRRLIALRQHYLALSRGSLELLAPENPKILAFSRDYLDQSVLVVANMSRFVQYVELDLSRFAGIRPIEVFGQTQFPTIGKAPYLLTLSSHSFYWFALEREGPDAAGSRTVDYRPPKFNVHAGWQEIVRGRPKRRFETTLSRVLARQWWFEGKVHLIRSVQIVDLISLGKTADAPNLLVLRVDYLEGESEMYLLPVGQAWGQEAERLAGESPLAVIAQFQRSSHEDSGILFDASAEPTVATAMLQLMAQRRRLKGSHGELLGWSTSAMETVASGGAEPLSAASVRVERTTSSMIFADKLSLKLFHRVENGVHPDLEMGRFLTENDAFPHTPKVVGAIDYRSNNEGSFTIGVLREYIPQATTAWQFAQDALARFFEHVMAQPPEGRPPAMATPGQSYVDLAEGDAPQLARDLLGALLEWSALLGRQTGELHLALASDASNADFAPEPFTQMYQRSLYQSSRKLALQGFHQLRAQLESLPPEAQAVARQALEREKQILEKLRCLLSQRFSAQRIRCHGDYHLGQVLYTGREFWVIDFAGESGRSLSARRLKQSVLQDVAAMIRSFQYAASESVLRLPMTGAVTPDALATWKSAAAFWQQWTSSAFLKAYLAATDAAELLPRPRVQLNLLLQVHLMARATYELQYELKNRPDRVASPLQVILELLDA